MKKFAFTLALAFACLLSAAQQPHKSLRERMQQGLSIEQISVSMQNRLTYTQRFDSIESIYNGERLVISHTYDDHANLSMVLESYYENGILEVGDKYVFAYDENNYRTLDAEYYWNGEIWRESEKSEYTYDANGNRLSELDYSYEEPTWKYTWTYNNDDQCLVEERWYFRTTGYTPEFRIENTYDANGNLTLCLRQQGESGGTWENYIKEEYAYDVNGNVILEVKYKWYSYDQDWEEEERTTYSYDVDNNMICKMHYGDILTNKYECTYDEKNRLILSIHTRTSGNYGNYWQNESKLEYEYDGNDSLILEAYYSGSGDDIETGWVNEYKTEYERNEAGCVTCMTSARGSLYSENGWRFVYRYLYEYDNCNRMISTTYLQWSTNENVFINVFKEICGYDDNGNILKYIYYDYEDGDWILDRSFENTYDLTVDADNILGLQQVYKDVFTEILPIEGNPVRNKWLSCRGSEYGGEESVLILYYSDYNDVNENEFSSLKAYSSEGTLIVENDNIADIQVFDIQGRLVAQQNQVAQCKFDLKPGVYVVKANDASVKAVVK